MVAQFFEKGDTEKIPETSKSHSLDISSEDSEIENEQQPETILIQESEHVTGKSLSEALIFASTNPQYDNKIFIELQVTVGF